MVRLRHRHGAVIVVATAALTVGAEACGDESVGPPVTTEPPPTTTIDPLPTTPPVPTPTSPAPDPEREVLVTDLVGEPVDGPMVGAVLGSYYCEVDGLDVAHYKCLGDGIELAMDTALNVSSVFLYAEGVDDFGEFTATMPYGLYWSEPWSEIEASWGPPTSAFEPSDGMFDPRFTVIYEGLAENYSIVTLEFTPDTNQLIKATFTA